VHHARPLERAPEVPQRNVVDAGDLEDATVEGEDAALAPAPVATRGIVLRTGITPATVDRSTISLRFPL
jgi:hypothetical protein